MSRQIRLLTSISGSNQPRLDDYMEAVNDMLGVAGNQWNNSGANGGAATRWDAAQAFNGNLAGVTGANLTAILQAIDDLALGDTDTSITAGTLATATSNRTADFGDFNLTFQNVAVFSVAADEAQLKGDAVTQPGYLKWFDNDDSHFFGVQAPATVTTSYTMVVPGAPGADNQVLRIASGGGTATLTMEWATVSAGGTDTSITEGALGNATSSRTVPMNGQSLTFDSVAGVTIDSTDAGVRITNTGANAGRLYLEETGVGTDTIGLTAPTSITTSVLYTLPEAPAANGYILSSTTAGVMSWSPKITGERAIIQLDTDYTAATQINLDGTSANQTLITGSDTIVFTGIASQADLFAAVEIEVYVDGIRAITTSTPTDEHNLVNFVSTTAFSLAQNLPAGTLVEIVKRSYV